MTVLKFKDVGQGDSIFISWNEEDKVKIGIIDCCKYAGRNPILEEIQAIKSDFEIAFLVISHGHQDHYSGIIELLNYCHYNGLIIQNVTSTLNPCQVQFVNLNAERSERKAISELLTSLKRFYKSGTIKETYPAYNNFTRFEIEDYILECLYPRHENYNILENNIDEYRRDNTKNLKNLNYISTIFKLANQSIYALLTSDCLTKSLNYIEKNDKDVQHKELHLAQVPHHGSINNHNEKFWKNRKRIADCPSVISSGESQYNLPNREVVQSFSALGYKIYSTNYVHGIKSYVENRNATKDYSFIVNNFSDVSGEYSIKKPDRLVGDKVFHLKETSIDYIPQN